MIVISGAVLTTGCRKTRHEVPKPWKCPAGTENPNVHYSVDCMPSPGVESAAHCAGEYANWLRENCPGLQRAD